MKVILAITMILLLAIMAYVMILIMQIVILVIAFATLDYVINPIARITSRCINYLASLVKGDANKK